MAFKFDAEMAHHLGMGFLQQFPGPAASVWNQNQFYDQYRLKLNCGLEWSFPVGLAAGLDKDAMAIDFFSQLYFGAIEVGTVTPKSQDGNPKPRLFRLKNDESLLNRMGFNNGGMEMMKKNILSSQLHGKVLGVNLGKNKITSAENAKDDYRILYREFASLSNYLVINVSSPNTPGLRDLQSKESLAEILDELKEERKNHSVPLFIKVSPDMAKEGYEDIVELALEYQLAGIIATNTTIMPDRGQGGVSGKLLTERSRNCRKLLLDMTRNTDLDIIGVGGISCFDDLREFWSHGGKVVQVYTSFIYQGPPLLAEIKEGIDGLLAREHCSLQEYLS